MEYQKIINLLDNASNQPSKFRTKNWVEINDESRGGYNVNSQIKFKTTMLKSSLCDYGDAYILVKGTITITGAGADGVARQTDKGQRNKGLIFKNRVQFINCKTEINNTVIDNAKDIDIVMPSGGCRPVNWLSQTRRNLTIQFLLFEFCKQKKIM